MKLQELTVTKVPIDSIRQDPKNPHDHSKKDLKAIRASLRRLGQVRPLIVHKETKRIIDGNGTHRIMKRLGYKECNVVELDVSEKEAVAITIALNQTQKLTPWHKVNVAKALELVAETFDLEDLGFTEREQAKLLGKPADLDDFGTADEAPDAMTYSVIVECESEQAQGELATELEERGYSCRLLIS